MSGPLVWASGCVISTCCVPPENWKKSAAKHKDRPDRSHHLLFRLDQASALVATASSLSIELCGFGILHHNQASALAAMASSLSIKLHVSPLTR